ncbi:unnamed protein product [Ixodes hexagonus]
MLLGDFNCVTDSQRDVRGPGFGRSTWNARELRRLIQHFDLVDCWTLLHGTTFEHTWRRGHSSSRLDRVYVNESPAVSVVACQPVDIPLTAGYISDHRPVLVELHLTTMANQQRFWRLDTRVLRGLPSRDRLKETLRRTLQGVAQDPRSWEHLQEMWRVACVAEGRALRQRLADQLRDTALRIRIVRRGGAGTGLMQGYITQLLARYQRLLRLSTNTATALQGPTGPSTHPEVIRYAYRTEVQERRVPITVVTPGMAMQAGQAPVASFSAHFRDLAT